MCGRRRKIKGSPKSRGVQSIFQRRGEESWLLIFACLFYFAFSFGLYTFTVESLYDSSNPQSITADSGTYFAMAGLSSSDKSVDRGSLVTAGGSSLGPVVLALIGRTQFGVACLDCLLYIVMVYWAGLIPGVRRDVFAFLLALQPQTLPTVLTLNKEILAITGLTALAAYIYSGQPRGRRRGSKWLLLASLVFSLLARWEQIFIPLWYLAVESRLSPIQGKPRKQIFALLLFLSAGWAAAVHVLHVNLTGFIKQAQGGGTITRLYSIQEKGGYFLVAFPKILLNVAGRWVTPGYFLSDYWSEDFTGNLQNQYIGFLSNLVMLGTLGFMIKHGRLRFSRPLVHIAFIYFIFSSINPFIQPRYIYPGFVLLVLELARRPELLEPVTALPKVPALPPSYRRYQERAAMRAAARGPNDELAYVIPLKVGLVVHQALRRRV